MTKALLSLAAAPRIIKGDNVVFVFGARWEQACELEGDHARLVEAVLEAARAPGSREEIVTRVLALAGVGLAERAAVDTAVDLLVKLGALVPLREETPPTTSDGSSSRGAHVVVCVTGAIGALHAPLLVERLMAAKHDVRVVMTRSSRRFITARSFEAITHLPVATGLWRRSANAPAPHVAIARWADVVVVYPCTATTLARLTAGDCSELVSAVVTTTRAPVLVAPSMNTQMLVSPAVTDNLERLRERGLYVLHTSLGAEVADAPAERSLKAGVAAPVGDVVRYVTWLIERTAASGPRLMSRADWNVEHERHHASGAVEDDLVSALDAHAAPPARVLEIGTGLGSFARAAAQKGHVVVATDFARKAVERAQAVDPTAPITWVVDDVTDTSLLGPFDLCVDRGCLGCIPFARRERYALALASLVRPSGVLVLKVYRAPARQLRAYGFTPEDVAALFAPWFHVLRTSESTLSFGSNAESPAILCELRRRA